jgi:shikimate dehydrogenase
MNDVSKVLASEKVLLGLIGAGIRRSLSPALHEEEGTRQGLRLHYQIIDLDDSGGSVDALPKLVYAARAMGFAGLNITYPCKQAVIPLLDELSDEARAMGAVNTIVFRGGRSIGHNTDGSGWTWGFRRALPAADLSQVVLLGAGGAGSAIAHAALRLGVKRLLICDVDAVRAANLASELNECYGGHRVASSRDIAQAIDEASGLIHATPTGMLKLPGLPLPETLLRSSIWVSEIVYFPLETALLKKARAIGCATVDGGGMAVGQALGAFELFTGITPDAARMQANFRALVATRSGE